ncbi:MAG: polysaccharide deacetylase family protein [Actinomycetota bacterium]|jgi:allantoinase|nr:polysaccharide deacetylase family protein [Actinomycetota bacterium]
MPEYGSHRYGPGELRHGMDHPHYPWSPLPDRPVLRWPNQAPLAVGAVVLLEHYEWEPPTEAYSLRQPSGGLMKLPSPDYVQLTHREYGHRVGIFRVLDALDHHGIPATVAIDALTADHYPWLVDHVLERGCEVIAHGVAASQLITSKLSADDERAMIDRSLASIERATGTRPRGWFSPEGVESFRTPQLLAEEGVDYLCDWPNDEQPYAMTVEHGQMSSLPLWLEVDDEHALWRRRAPIDSWVSMMRHSADQLYADGATTGRMMMLTLRPWLIGQPFRIGHLDQALSHIKDLGRLFLGTGSQLVDAERSGRESG